MKRGFSDGLYFLWADIRHDWLRTLLTLTGLATVVFCYFVLSSLSNALSEFYQTEASGKNLVVIQADFIDPSDATMDPAVYEAVRAMSAQRVARVAPVIYRHMRVEEHVIMLRSAPLEDWKSVFHLELMDGAWPKDFGEVSVGEGAAEAYGWEVGSRITIYGLEFRVASIVRSPGTAFSSIWMPFNQGVKLFGEDRGYQALVVQTNPFADAEEVLREIQENRAVAGKFTVFFEDTYSRRDNQLLKDVSGLMTVASYLALLGIIMGTYSSTSLTLIERSREMGILRAIGYSHQKLSFLVAVRALLVGWAAFIIGLTAALAYVLYQQSLHQFSVLGFHIIFQLDGNLILSGFLITAAFSLLGAWFSSLQLFQQPIQHLLKEINP